MIQKTRPHENFTPVSNEVFRDKRLNLTDRGLLATLMSLPPNWDFTVEGMAAILPDGRGRIKSSLKRLEKIGYITVIHERDKDGRFAKNRLIMNSVAGQTHNDHPSAENRPADNRPAEKDEQYKNTNNTRTKNTRVRDDPEGLPQSDYEELVNEFGKELVDSQIKKIKEKRYTHCMNRDTIRAWCEEKTGRTQGKLDTPFNNFEQREYTSEFFEHIENKDMKSGNTNGDRADQES